MRSLLIATTFIALTAQAKTLSWPESLELATKNNADLRAAISDLKSAEAKFSAANGVWFPHLAAGLSYDKNNRANALLTGTATASGYSASVSASENLFAGLTNHGAIEQARSAVHAAEANVASVKAKLSYDLKNAFEGFANARDSVRLTGEILKRRQENYRLVEARFQNGNENKGSVLLSKAYLNQASYENLQAENTVTVAQLQLLNALGTEPFADGLTITGDVPTSEPGTRPDNLEQLVDQTPEIKKAQADEESARWAISTARAAFYPTLALTGSVSQTGTEFFPDDRKNWAWGLGLTVPLFDGGRDYYSTIAASQNYSASASRRVGVRQQLRQKLESSYMAFAEGVAKLKVDESFLEAAATRADIARHKYNNGLLTFEDWDVIENDLISRQKTVLQSRKDRVVSEAGWEQARGVGVIP